MKNIFAFLFSLSISGIFFGQEKAILKILNLELKREIKNQFKSSNFEGDTISIVKPFTINENKVLSFEIKKRGSPFEGYQLIRQEVPLNQIKKIGKDVQLILETEPKSVITIYTNTLTHHTEKISGNLYFLYLFNEKQTENLGLELQSAFKKAGYFVEKNQWYE